jgi:hypothetical protein
MSSINSRFKGLGFGKRRSGPTNTQSSDELQPPSQTSTPGQGPQFQPPGQTPPLGASSSTSSLPMNHQGPAHRPPSYTGNFQQGAAPPVGRNSPLAQGLNRTPPTQMAGGPPPINTGAPLGYPPGMNHPQGPPMGGPPPPGFGGQAGYPPPVGGPIAQQFQRNPAAEVEGASKSKAQLIVGIDFVSRTRTLVGRSCACANTTSTGNHFLRCSVRFRNKQ